MATRIFYITNCLVRILQAPCSPYLAYLRAQDLAEIYIRTAEEGDIWTQERLFKLCEEAEAGRYALLAPTPTPDKKGE